MVLFVNKFILGLIVCFNGFGNNVWYFFLNINLKWGVLILFLIDVIICVVLIVCLICLRLFVCIKLVILMCIGNFK